jgi:PiT family inorganic phosphate transporter
MEHSFLMAAAVITLALLFNFSNGFNDSASQVATVIASRALTPEAALTIAAAANFIGAYWLGTTVAATIGRGIVHPDALRASGSGILILIGALIGGGLWNLITWRFGLPSSSSHALIGGLLGAFLVGCGPHLIQWANVRKIVAVMFAAPFVGFGFTYLVTKLTFFFTQWASPRANRVFKGFQVVSLVGQALAHGSNDGQKSMGLITFALIVLDFYRPPAGAFAVPGWVLLVCSGTLALGILCGGWRIIRTLGSGLFRVRPIHGFAALASSAAVIHFSSVFGFPVSTTQAMSSSVMGAGAAFRPKSVRWAVATDMLTAWLITIPASGLMAAASYAILRWTRF